MTNEQGSETRRATKAARMLPADVEDLRRAAGQLYADKIITDPHIGLAAGWLAREYLKGREKK